MEESPMVTIKVIAADANNMMRRLGQVFVKEIDAEKKILR
jgi:hypothetical protein